MKYIALFNWYIMAATSFSISFCRVNLFLPWYEFIQKQKKRTFLQVRLDKIG